MLIRNSALYTVAKLLPGLFGLATTAALTRLLEPHEYGLYGLALVVMTLGSIILFDWLGLSFLRFYQSRRDDPSLVPTFICMFVALAIVSAVALSVALISGSSLQIWLAFPLSACSWSGPAHGLSWFPGWQWRNSSRLSI